MDKETLQRELGKAKVLLLRKNFTEAEAIYKKILNDEYDNLDANLGLLKCHSKNYTEYDNPEIDGDIEVIDSLWPRLDDEYYVSYKNLKKRGTEKVEMSDMTKLRLAEEALEKEREERDQYLGFVPEETLEFFPWYDDIEDLKDALFEKLKKKHGNEFVYAKGSYMGCLKNYTEKDDVKCLPKGYFSYGCKIDSAYRFNPEEQELHVAVWLHEIEKGENLLVNIRLPLFTLLYAQDQNEKGYVFKLKQHDLDAYNNLVLKFLEMDYGYNKEAGPIAGENEVGWRSRVSELKQQLEDWKKKIGK